MRTTSFTIFNQLTRSLSSNLRILSRFSNMLSTGKKINNPSDDVSGMMKAMDYKVSINAIEQYKRNIDEANAHLSFADTTMSSVTNLLIRAREMAVQGSTDSVSRQDRTAMSEEVAELRDELLSLSNGKFRNKYIYSGFKTGTPAYDTSFTYQGDAGEVNVLIDHNAAMAINIPGDQVFSYGGTAFMRNLDDLYNALRNPASTSADIALYIDDIDNALDKVANVRADIGARLNHLDDRRDSLENRDVSLKTYLSETLDTDIAETVSDISKTELALQSLRQSGAEILSQSLLSFLR